MVIPVSPAYDTKPREKRKQETGPFTFPHPVPAPRSSRFGGNIELLQEGIGPLRNKKPGLSQILYDGVHRVGRYGSPPENTLNFHEYFIVAMSEGFDVKM